MEISSDISQKYGAKYGIIFKIIIALALIFFLVYFIQFDKLIEAFKKANYFYIFLAFILIFPNVYFQFLKWEITSNTILNVNDRKKIFNSLFYGFSAGIVTPIRLGEYLGRKIPYENISITKVTVATLVDKLISLIIVLFTGLISLSIFILLYYTEYAYYALPVLIIGIALILSFIILVFRKVRIGGWLERHAAKYKFIKRFSIELSYLQNFNTKIILLLVFFSTLFYSTYIFQFAFLVKAFTNAGNFFGFLLAGTLVMFTKTVFSFISFADLGVRESSAVVLLSIMGYSQVAGFNASIILFFMNLVLPSILGFFLLFRKK